MLNKGHRVFDLWRTADIIHDMIERNLIFDLQARFELFEDLIKHSPFQECVDRIRKMVKKEIKDRTYP